jgi:hypothetical protein
MRSTVVLRCHGPLEQALELLRQLMMISSRGPRPQVLKCVHDAPPFYTTMKTSKR